jgi:hypothetical protein
VVLTPLTSEFSFGTDQLHSDSTKTVTSYPTESKQFLNDLGDLINVLVTEYLKVPLYATLFSLFDVGLTTDLKIDLEAMQQHLV